MEQEWVQHGAVLRGCSHSASQIGSITAVLILFLPLFPHITHMTGGGQQGGWHLEHHRHLYTQGAGSIPAVGSALHPWPGR